MESKKLNKNEYQVEMCSNIACVTTLNAFRGEDVLG